MGATAFLLCDLKAEDLKEEEMLKEACELQS